MLPTNQKPGLKICVDLMEYLCLNNHGICAKHGFKKTFLKENKHIEYNLIEVYSLWPMP